MGLRQLLKRSNAAVGLVNDLRRIRATLGRESPHRAVEAYSSAHAIRKLHLGAGTGSLPGWLNTDIDILPDGRGVVYLDATRTFPIETGTFDYVYSEHMIEHIPWEAGLLMLRECRRVLKPGGIIRIATPDLAVLLRLYGDCPDPAGQQYIRWIVDRYLNGASPYKASFVINNAFRNWGHQFLYDGDLLEMALQNIGFTRIRRCNPGESTDEHLRGIECHGTNVREQAMAAFETMVFEAERPREARGG